MLLLIVFPCNKSICEVNKSKKILMKYCDLVEISVMYQLSLSRQVSFVDIATFAMRTQRCVDATCATSRDNVVFQNYWNWYISNEQIWIMKYKIVIIKTMSDIE